MMSVAALSRTLEEYRIARNAVLLLIANITTRALTIVYVALLARYVGPNGIGIISTATAVTGILVLIVGAGLNTLTVREVSAANERAPVYASHMLLLRFLLGLPFAIAIVITARVAGYDELTTRVISVYGIVYWFDSLAEIPIAIFQAFERMELECVSQIVQVVVNVLLSILAIYLDWSLLAIGAISALSQGCKLALAFALMRRRFVPSLPGVTRRQLLRFFWVGLPFGAFVLLSVLRFQVGVLVLSVSRDARDVGIYSTATSLLSMLMILPAVFATAIYPAFSHAYAHARDQLRQFYQACYKVLLVIGFPLGMGTILVGEHVIRLVYGDDFSEASQALSILGVFLMAIVGYCNGPLLNAANRQWFFAWTEAVAVMANIVLCLILVPRVGPSGAALGVLVPGLGTFAVHSLVCHRILGLSLPVDTLARVLAATAIMGLAVSAALDIGIGWFGAAIGIAPLVYGSLLLALKIVTRGDLQLVARAGSQSNVPKASPAEC